MIYDLTLKFSEREMDSERRRRRECITDVMTNPVKKAELLNLVHILGERDIYNQVVFFLREYNRGDKNLQSKIVDHILGI